MVGVPLQDEGGGVSGEGLRAPDGLATLGKQGQARVPQVVEADGGRPARRSSGLKLLFTTFCASSRGLPRFEANTRPFSCHSAPAFSLLAGVSTSSPLATNYRSGLLCQALGLVSGLWAGSGASAGGSPAAPSSALIAES